jgi:hypothetical protein
MAFLDDLAAAIADPACRAPINKASIANMLSAGFASLWRATGVPAQAAIPGAAAIPTKATAGALRSWTNPASGRHRYLAASSVAMSVVGASIEFVDRVAHMGGLSATSLAVQAVGIDVNSLKGTRVATDVSNVEWWLEIYTDIGTTATTGTIVYVSDTDASNQNIAGFAIGGASPANRAGRMFPITPVAGHPIRSITSFTQVASTVSAAGSYGFTATVPLGNVVGVVANRREKDDWASLPIARLHENACIAMVMQCLTTSTGTVTGHASVPDVFTPA